MLLFYDFTLERVVGAWRSEVDISVTMDTLKHNHDGC